MNLTKNVKIHTLNYMSFKPNHIKNSIYDSGKGHSLEQRKSIH